MNKILTIIAALAISATASAGIIGPPPVDPDWAGGYDSITEYLVPQDFGPNTLWVDLDPEYSFGADYVYVDAMSTLTVDVYWGEDVVNPNTYRWTFLNATDVLMVWDDFHFGYDMFAMELGMTLQHHPPRWGHNDSAISIGSNPIAVVPGPGGLVLLGAAGLVSMRRRAR